MSSCFLKELSIVDCSMTMDFKDGRFLGSVDFSILGGDGYLAGSFKLPSDFLIGDGEG